MSSLKDVFRVLAEMRDEGVVTDYAIGGATAVLFYVEPTRTYDLDVFVTLPSGSATGLVSLSAVYEWAARRGIEIQGEHLLQFGGVDRQRLRTILETHAITAEIPDDV